jgi:hypothetical protein
MGASWNRLSREILKVWRITEGIREFWPPFAWRSSKPKSGNLSYLFATNHQGEALVCFAVTEATDGFSFRGQTCGSFEKIPHSSVMKLSYNTGYETILASANHS